MRKRYIWALLAAAVLLVACTSREATEDGIILILYSDDADYTKAERHCAQYGKIAQRVDAWPNRTPPRTIAVEFACLDAR